MSTMRAVKMKATFKPPNQSEPTDSSKTGRSFNHEANPDLLTLLHFIIIEIDESSY
jgi:hypothetical protein